MRFVNGMLPQLLPWHRVSHFVTKCPALYVTQDSRYNSSAVVCWKHSQNAEVYSSFSVECISAEWYTAYLYGPLCRPRKRDYADVFVSPLLEKYAIMRRRHICEESIPLYVNSNRYARISFKSCPSLQNIHSIPSVLKLLVLFITTTQTSPR